MKRPDLSSPPTYEEALRLARDQARDPGTLIPYPHPGLENACYGRGFAFLETLRTDSGDTDAYVLVSAAGYGSGLLSEAGHTIDTVIAEHLAQAEHANRDIPDSELAMAQRVALRAYDAGLTRIGDMPGRKVIDAETADYAEYILLILRRNRDQGDTGRNILAHNDSLLKDPTPGRRYTQPCPRCERPATYSERYPRAVCDHCGSRTTDQAGRRVTGYNVDMSGGMIAYYADAIGPSDGPDSRYEECVEVTRTGECFIDGHPATMQEARFGGIVVEMAAQVPDTVSREALWAMTHAERAALAEDLAELDDSRWAQQSLCGRWTVQEVVAHLTAAASTGRLRWLVSVLGARFDFDKHNDRRLAEHRGTSTAETLERFRAVRTSTTAPTGHTAAWLGEVLVHAQDIRQPLGIPREPSIAAATEVARFFAGRNFTVPSRSMIKGIRLEATDGPFSAGTGPVVSGTTIALIMAMAGRTAYLDDLTGPGVPTLRALQRA